MKNRSTLKRVTVITLCVVGGLLLLAVILGVLNALVADGKWSFGWKSYRYDETGFEMGGGSIAVDGIQGISVDWIDGEVRFEVCQDTYVSLSEESANELPESALLRWRVNAEGILEVKYRKPSTYFGSIDRQKRLTVRIPEATLDELQMLELDVVSSNVMIEGISVPELDFESVSGNLIAKSCIFGTFDAETVSGALVCDSKVTDSYHAETVSGSVLLISPVCPANGDVETTSGEVKLTLPADSALTLNWETVGGKLLNGLGLTGSGNRYTSGDGKAKFSVETVSGDLSLAPIQN